MARQILPIAGQIIGGMIGGPVGAAIGGAIGGAVGQYVDPIRHQGPKLGEARAQTAQEGVYRPLVFGTGCVSGNVIHRSPRKVVRHRESVGKGNRDTVDSDRGYRTFAIRIAEAHTPEGYQLLRIWENETLVYDVRPESEIPQESAEYAEKFRFYAGTEDQLPDPDLEAYLGVGNVNSYRGSCYIVFGNFDLTDYGDMVPQFRLEIASDPHELPESQWEYVQDVGLNMTDIAYGAGWWVAVGIGVGAAGEIWAAEHNASTWIKVGGHPNYQLNSIAYGAGLFVASRDFNNVLVSPVPGGPWEDVVTQSNSAYLVTKWTGSRFIRMGHGGAVEWAIDPRGEWTTADSGTNGTIRHALAIGETVIAFTQTGEIRRSTNGGVSGWSGPTIVGTDPAPVEAFTGAAAEGGVIRAYKQVGPVDVAVYTSIDGGVTFEADLYTVPPAKYNGGQIGIIEGRWVGSNTASVPAPSYPKMFVSDDGLPPFVEEDVVDGSGAASSGSGSSVFRIIDSHEGVGIGLGNKGGGGNRGFIYRNQYQLPPVFGDRVPLSSVVHFCHRRVGQPSSEFDVSALDDLLDGVVFADGYTARDAITTLLPIYNADASEHDRGSGYRINYIKRGAPVVRTLTIDDLVDEPEETVREDPMERPRVLHMAFESPITGYTAGKASIQRLSPDVRLVNEVSTYVPVTFKDVDEAWQRADVQMRVAWTEVHGERKFSISDAHIDLVPTDNVGLSLRGQVQRLRLRKDEYADGVIKLESVADRQSNYTSHVTGIPLPAPEKPPPSLMGPAALAILDIPAISDQHDRLGYYVGVTGTADAFAGAVLQQQQNGQWSDIATIGRSQRTTMGVLESTVTAGSPHYTDTTNTVSVTLYMDDELESLSNAQWLNKGGAFALETATGWEIMQYRDAYQDSGGVWHLTHLARGRLNTVADEHLPGSRFVLLDGVRFVDADVGMIGQPLTLRAAAVGRSPETAVPETITYHGNSQREFPVANLAAELDGSTLGMSAIPRDRFGTEQHPVRSANHDGFRWAATDGSITVTTDTDHATASLDASGLSMPITVTVAQLNRFTGAGPTVSEQVE